MLPIERVVERRRGRRRNPPHTQANLMEELAKVRRVIAQKQEGAPNETLLVVDEDFARALIES
jgi:signal recognition particle GTPase